MSSPRSLLRRKAQFLVQRQRPSGEWWTLPGALGGLTYMAACELAARYPMLELRVIPKQALRA
jgi:hypothetical protein